MPSDRFEDYISKEENLIYFNQYVGLMGYYVFHVFSMLQITPIVAVSLGVLYQFNYQLFLVGLMFCLIFSINPGLINLIVIIIPVLLLTTDFNLWFVFFLLLLYQWRAVESVSNNWFELISYKSLKEEFFNGDYKFKIIKSNHDLLKPYFLFNAKLKLFHFFKKNKSSAHLFAFADKFRDSPIIILEAKPKGNRRVLSAAVTFPFLFIPSIVLIRKDFSNLVGSKLFQVLHEISHSTYLGYLVYLRSFRWRAAEKLFYISVWVILFYLGFHSIVNDEIILTPLLLAACAVFFRSNNMSHTIRLNDGAGEALADSLALSHSAFQPEKWKDIAKNKIKQITTENEFLSKNSDEKSADKIFTNEVRIMHLSRHLKANKVQPYTPVEGITSIYVVILFVFAGIYLPIGSGGVEIAILCYYTFITIKSIYMVFKANEMMVDTYNEISYFLLNYVTKENDDESKNL